MTKDELLAKAKKDYFIGTKFYSAVDSKYSFTITSNKINYKENEIRICVDNYNDNTNDGACVYYNGKWATIISKPEGLLTECEIY